MRINAGGAPIHLSERGDGPTLVLLNGGGGCPNYLAPVAELLPEFRCPLPDPRGTGQSTGGVHDLATAVSDLEAIRAALGVAYTLAHPGRVTRLVSWAGTGIQNDRDWHTTHEAGKDREPRLDVDWNAAIHRALLDDWRRFIRRPGVLMRLSRLEVPLTFLHLGADIRPGWPAAQRAAPLPWGEWQVPPDAPHNAWLTHAPELGAACGPPCTSDPPPFGGRSSLAPAPTLRA